MANVHFDIGSRISRAGLANQMYNLERKEVE